MAKLRDFSKKRPYGIGFLLKGNGTLYYQMFNDNQNNIIGTECIKNESIKQYKIFLGGRIYTSEKIIMPNGCFVGHSNMLSGYDGDYFDDSGVVYTGYFSPKFFTKLLRAEKNKNVISSENEKNIFTVLYPNGEKYVGLLKDGVKIGKGELVSKNGEKSSNNLKIAIKIF